MATYSDFVRDGYQRPIPGAKAKLFSADGSTLIATATTGIDGQFTLDAPDAKYVLQVSFGGVSDRSSVIVGNPPEYVGPPGQGLPDLMGPGGSALVGTQLDAAGAVPLDQATVNNLQFNIFKLFPKAMQASITGRTLNNTKATAIALALVIQGGINEAAARGADLVIPAGLYNIAPTANFDAEAGSIGRCFSIPDNMKVVAAPGATFRIVNGVSTDAAPFFHCMFGTNGEHGNVSWSGLEMDMNGQNNPISPNRANGVYALYNQAMIHVTGTPGGRAARINNASIDNCRFVNCPGVSCVVMGQSNTPNSGLGSGWSWTNSVCYNNGLDTIDHSSGYGWAENVTITDNEFYNDQGTNPTSGVGGLVGYEIHGSHTTFARNRVRNYYQGLWLDGNSTANSYSVQVLNNTLDQIGAFGILFFGQSATAAPVHGALIQGNTVTLDDTVYAGIDLKYGIGTAGQYSQTDVRVLDNYVRGLGTATAKGGVVVTAGTIVGQKHDGWLIKGNTFENVTAGVFLNTNATVGLGSMKVLGNTAKNLTPAGAFTVPQGVAVSSGNALIDDLMIVGNDFLDSRGAPLASSVGVRVEGTVGSYTMYDNRAPGAAISYSEVNFSAQARRGRFVTAFPYDPALLATGASTFADIVTPNAVLGDKVSASMNVPLNGCTIFAEVQSAGIVRATFRNPTAATVDIGSGTIFVALERMA
ncbi:hypothetical protein O6V14_02985 [Sphingomonas faeni]|uniref:right-handed parallel beta-helix repeat-containing protein n=1 Tax=Sphingomonas faeni TaxID=185950 RepID=UPI00334C9189